MWAKNVILLLQNYFSKLEQKIKRFTFAKIIIQPNNLSVVKNCCKKLKNYIWFNFLLTPFNNK
jgi:hypothetical protein